MTTPYLTIFHWLMAIRLFLCKKELGEKGVVHTTCILRPLGDQRKTSPSVLSYHHVGSRARSWGARRGHKGHHHSTTSQLLQLFYCVVTKATPHLEQASVVGRTAVGDNCMLTFLKESFSNPFGSTINAQAS